MENTIKKIIAFRLKEHGPYTKVDFVCLLIAVGFYLIQKEKLKITKKLIENQSDNTFIKAILTFIYNTIGNECKSFMQLNEDSLLRCISDRLHDDVVKSVIMVVKAWKTKDNRQYLDFAEDTIAETELLKISFGKMAENFVLTGTQSYTSNAVINISNGRKKNNGALKCEEYEKASAELDQFWNNNESLKTFQISNPIVWKQCISKKVYEGLKERLAACGDADSKSTVENHAVKIVVFLGEWFKREDYNENRRQNRHLWYNEIKLNGNCSQKVWEYSGINDKYLRIAGSQRQFEYSMFLLGGFPIGNIANNSNTERYRGVFHKIWELQNNNAFQNNMTSYLTEQILGEIALEFHESAFWGRDLNTPDSSLRTYIKVLLGNTENNLLKGLVSTDDLKEREVVEFEKVVREGEKEYYKEIFKDTWTIYKNGSLLECYCTIQINTDNNKCEGYLPKGFFRNRNLTTLMSNNYFDIYADIHGVNSQKIKLFTCYPSGQEEKWIVSGFGKSQVKIFNVNPLVSKIELTAVYEEKGCENSIPLGFSIEPKKYIQLYWQGRNWTTSKIRSGSDQSRNGHNSALLFSQNEYIEDEDFDVEAIDFEHKDYPEYQWVEFPYKITLTESKDKKVDFFNSGSRISINILPVKGMHYNKYGQVVFSNGGTESAVYLVYGTRNLNLECFSNINSEKIDYSKLQIGWSQGYNSSDDWNQLPNTGLITLYVKRNGMQNAEWSERVFYVNTDRFLDRNIDKLRITVSCQGSVSKDGKTFEDSVCMGVDDINLDKDTVRFYLGNPERKVYLDVYIVSKERVDLQIANKIANQGLDYKRYPCPTREDYENDIKNGNAMHAVPFIFRHSFYLREITEEGVSRHRLFGEKGVFEEIHHHNFTINDAQERRDNVILGANNVYEATINQSFKKGTGKNFANIVIKCAISNRKYTQRDLQTGVEIIPINGEKYVIKRAVGVRQRFSVEGLPNGVNGNVKIDIQRNANDTLILFQNGTVATRHFYSFSQLGNEVDLDVLQLFEVVKDSHTMFRTFRVFERTLVDRTDADIISFFCNLCKRRVELSEEDKLALWHLSDEFHFDWLFLNNAEWINQTAGDKHLRDCAQQLFEYCRFKLEGINDLNSLMGEFWLEKDWNKFNLKVQNNKIKVVMKMMKYMDPSEKNATSSFTGNNRKIKEICNLFKEVNKIRDKYHILRNELSKLTK